MPHGVVASWSGATAGFAKGWDFPGPPYALRRALLAIPCPKAVRRRRRGGYPRGEAGCYDCTEDHRRDASVDT